MSAACRVLGLNRSSVLQRRLGRVGSDTRKHSRQQAAQPRALSGEERENVSVLLRSETYSNQPPAEIYQRLLEQGKAPCSISTMHRILRQEGGNGERREQRPAQHHAIPRLKASTPNQVWTWDISKLAVVSRGVYLSLYAVTDLFSRFTVAWMVSLKENSALAMQLMNAAVARYSIEPGQLTLHQDRGSPMTANGYLGDMKQLDITCSHSRPRVSNDNPFSESGFRTLKYQPDYPGKFNSASHARNWCNDYYEWYNFSHHHSGLNGYTPEQVFTGSYADVALIKQAALDDRYQQNPERFVNGRPKVKLPPTEVCINPISDEDVAEGAEDKVNFPTLATAGHQRIAC
jgi:putative transposase